MDNASFIASIQDPSIWREILESLSPEEVA